MNALEYNRNQLRYKVASEWDWEIVPKKEVKKSGLGENKNLELKNTSEKGGYDAPRYRKKTVGALFLGVDISTFEAQNFVLASIDSWLHGKLGGCNDDTYSPSSQNTVNGFFQPHLMLENVKDDKDAVLVVKVVVKTQHGVKVLKEKRFDHRQATELRQAIQRLLNFTSNEGVVVEPLKPLPQERLDLPRNLKAAKPATKAADAPKERKAAKPATKAADAPKERKAAKPATKAFC
jgi:hypothetical protein